MSGTLFVPPRYTPVNSTGRPYPLSTLTFHLDGTTTLVNVYTTAACSVAHSNPLTSNSAGLFPAIYINPETGPFKATLKNSAGSTLWTEDVIPAEPGVSQASVGAALYPRSAAEITAGVTPSSYAYNYGDPRRFGSTLDGVVDDSATLNTTLSVGGTVRIPAGLTAKATNLTMSVAGTELVIEAGATISQSTAANKLITVSGANCTISGPGKLLGPASWLGTNTGEPTMAVLWVTGAGFTLRGVTLENIYKCGIYLDDATNARFLGNRFIGNFPYASYGGTNTGHWAILYNPPTSTYADILGVVISDNLFETCVQGVGIANYGSTAYEVGVAISGNRFAQCWDHGIYTQLGEGTQITGNSFVDCHSPIVAQGVGCVVSGNSLYSTEPTNTNGQQILSVRDALNCVIVGNTVYGLGASIYIDALDGTNLTGNVISGNTVVQTGAGTATSAIRLGNLAQTCSNNIISGNVISGGYFGEFVGAIQLEMASTYYGQNNVVKDNVVALSNKTYGILFGDQKNGICAGNLVYSTDDAASGETHILIGIADSQTSDVRDNRLNWVNGGTNITARGIDVASGCVSVRLKDNTFNLSSGSLVAGNNIVDAGTTTYIDQVTRGVTASVADGGTITHGHVKTPTSARVSASTASEFASVTAIGATTITVAIKKHDNSAGTTQTIYWDVAG